MLRTLLIAAVLAASSFAAAAAQVPRCVAHEGHASPVQTTPGQYVYQVSVRNGCRGTISVQACYEAHLGCAAARIEPGSEHLFTVGRTGTASSFRYTVSAAGDTAPAPPTPHGAAAAEPRGRQASLPTDAPQTPSQPPFGGCYAASDGSVRYSFCFNADGHGMMAASGPRGGCQATLTWIVNNQSLSVPPFTCVGSGRAIQSQGFSSPVPPDGSSFTMEGRTFSRQS